MTVEHGFFEGQEVEAFFASDRIWKNGMIAKVGPGDFVDVMFFDGAGRGRYSTVGAPASLGVRPRTAPAPTGTQTRLYSMVIHEHVGGNIEIRQVHLNGPGLVVERADIGDLTFLLNVRPPAKGEKREQLRHTFVDRAPQLGDGDPSCQVCAEQRSSPVHLERVAVDSRSGADSRNCIGCGHPFSHHAREGNAWTCVAPSDRVCKGQPGEPPCDCKNRPLDRFREGQRIEVMIGDRPEWYPATITEIRQDEVATKLDGSQGGPVKRRNIDGSVNGIRPLFIIRKDGRCDCNAGDGVCPLGRVGAEIRCSKDELLKLGHVVVDQADVASHATSAESESISPVYYKGDRVMQIIEEFGLGFFDGNVLKYILRYKAKGGVVDLKKARTYLDRLIATLENAGKETP